MERNLLIISKYPNSSSEIMDCGDRTIARNGNKLPILNISDKETKIANRHNLRKLRRREWLI